MNKYENVQIGDTIQIFYLEKPMFKKFVHEYFKTYSSKGFKEVQLSVIKMENLSFEDYGRNNFLFSEEDKMTFCETKMILTEKTIF